MRPWDRNPPSKIATAQGYGVELAVKNIKKSLMEYKVLDDRSIDGESNEAIVEEAESIPFWGRIGKGLDFANPGIRFLPIPRDWKKPILQS